MASIKVRSNFQHWRSVRLHLMCTPKTLRSLAVLLLVALPSSCEKPLDSPEFGELINEVPLELNRPFPLPELDQPKSDPLAKPAPLEPEAGAKAAENPAAPDPIRSTSDENSAEKSKNHE
jgi:hypothetical protein